ncbi:TetR/AcrR family transcriptional regulator [Nocardia terpenica]|uniref:TetR/AcrR family transcriptional regulator n=1 Tax=Nocardia terpenica TaxID=455432 RepID=UPI0012FD6F32|nr:TetR/AcrR family transcriptional regulator [Nocardia terpenica]
MERRTQQQRKEATVAKLIDAAIETIVQDGYYRTTVAAVCERAGVSVGALFRHFENRFALIAQVADEISRRILEAADAGLASARNQPDSVEAGLALLSGLSFSPLVAAWHEMMVAARTDEKLREHIAPALPMFYDGILERAKTLGALKDVPESMHEIVLFSITQMFSGAALTGSVYPRPDLDVKRIPLAVFLITHSPEI